MYHSYSLPVKRISTQISEAFLLEPATSMVDAMRTASSVYSSPLAFSSVESSFPTASKNAA